MSTDTLSVDYLLAFSDSLKIQKIILMFISIGILVLISKTISLLSKRLYIQIPTKKTLIFQISTVFTFFLNVAGSVYIFYEILNPPKELLIAFLGSATFAIGFALKDLASSVISGVAIIMDPPFQVGDRIEFKNTYGEITHVGLRAVRLKTLDNQTVTIPNSSFVNDIVLCTTQGKININVITNFYFDLNSNIKQAKQILYETVVTSRYAYLKEPIIMVVNNCWQQEKLYLQLTVKAHVLDARFEKAFQTDIVSRGTTLLLEAKCL